MDNTKLVDKANTSVATPNTATPPNIQLPSGGDRVRAAYQPMALIQQAQGRHE